MIMQRNRWCLNLKLKCLIIGYMNLIASIIDIGIHIAIVGIITRGFQCDATEESLKNIDWPWLEPFLLILNLGTHGFYPFPMILRNRNNLFFDYQIITLEPRCYFGMLHVNLIDILNFFINVIWLRFVRAYVVALHKKDPEPMRMFFGLSLVKLIIQIMYYTYQPGFFYINNADSYWFIKLLDMIMATIFLFIIHAHTRQVRAEREQTEQPPPYVECLVSVRNNREKTEKKDTQLYAAEETKKNIENISETV